MGLPCSQREESLSETVVDSVQVTGGKGQAWDCLNGASPTLHEQKKSLPTENNDALIALPLRPVDG